MTCLQICFLNRWMNNKYKEDKQYLTFVLFINSIQLEYSLFMLRMNFSTFSCANEFQHTSLKTEEIAIRITYVYFLIVTPFCIFKCNQQFVINQFNSLTEPLSISLHLYQSTIFWTHHASGKEKKLLCWKFSQTMKIITFVDYYDHFCWNFFLECIRMFKIFDRYISLWSPIKLIIQWSQIILMKF